MIEAKTRREMFFKTYTCGWDIKKGDPDFLSSSYQFPSFAALMDRFDEAAKGLLACETDISQVIGRDLKR